MAPSQYIGLALRLCPLYSRYLFVPIGKGIRCSVNTYPTCETPLLIRERFAPLQKIVPISPFFGVNRSPMGYGFRIGAKAIRVGSGIV